MMRRDLLYRLYPLIALGAFAAATSWLDRIAKPPTEAQRDGASNSPDMIVEGFTLQRFDHSGRQQYTFSADQMRHFTLPERTELVEPRLRMFGATEGATARARSGSVSASGETVRLEGDVVVERGASADRAAATLLTEALTLWPETERAAGDRPVRYIEGLSEIDAGSFTADHLNGTIQLGGGVVARIAR